MANAKGIQLEKGYLLEELLRAYFLRAGFFAVRGVPFQHSGDDLTDIDIWLYERPTGYSRRRQIVDAKSKTKPKAIERILWTKGLAQLLDVDGAYVATTDGRSMLRDISQKLGISILDGADIKRISESKKVLFPDRMSEEELTQEIVSVDKLRRNREFLQQYRDLKHSLIDGFGAGTINRALDAFGFFSSAVVTSHPQSDAAYIALRLAYFSGAVVALALDYVASEVSFRTADERRAALVNAIRYGHVSQAEGLEKVRLSIALLRKYASGDAAVRAVEMGLEKDLGAIPAEMIADHISKRMKPEDLFQVARRLEFRCFQKAISSFDHLGLDDKAFVGVLLDYTGIQRASFASAVISSGNVAKQALDIEKDAFDAGPLFSEI